MGLEPIWTTAKNQFSFLSKPSTTNDPLSSFHAPCRHFFSVAENNAKRTNAEKVIVCRAHAISKKEPVDGTPKVEGLFFLHFFMFYLTLKG
jgi:hypothetical protein